MEAGMAVDTNYDKKKKKVEEKEPIPTGQYKMPAAIKQEVLQITLKEFDEKGPVRLIVDMKGGPSKMAKRLFDSYVFQAKTSIPVPPEMKFPFVVCAFRRPMKVSRQVRGDGSVINPEKPKTWPVIAQVRGMDHGNEMCDHYDFPCPDAVEYASGLITDTKTPWIISVKEKISRAED